MMSGTADAAYLSTYVNRLQPAMLQRAATARPSLATALAPKAAVTAAVTTGPVKVSDPSTDWISRPWAASPRVKRPPECAEATWLLASTTQAATPTLSSTGLVAFRSVVSPSRAIAESHSPILVPFLRAEREQLPRRRSHHRLLRRQQLLLQPAAGHLLRCGLQQPAEWHCLQQIQRRRKHLG